LDLRRADRDGRMWCPDCGARISIDEDDSDDGIRSDRGAARPAARQGSRSRRFHDDDDDTPIRKRQGSSHGGMIVLVVVAAIVSLGLIGGAIWYALKDSGSSAPVAVADGDPPADKTKPIEAAPPKDPIAPVDPGNGEVGRTGTLPLKELKDASVFIKAMTETKWATGSGFVVQAQGDTVFVVTNHHVVTPPKDGAPVGPGRGPFLPRPPRIRPPRLHRQATAAGGPGGHPVAELSAIFYSGTPQEESCKAVIVGDDAEADLVVLKVTGVKNAPRPIDCRRTPELLETTPVVAFGFPFGEELDPKHGNPAVTVTKGAVSSLRRDHGELREVQMDLDLNPGNSGGPVVDEKGALIGIAVAKITNTRIGYAVPVQKLQRLLQGKIDPPSVLRSVNNQGRTEIQAIAAAADPLCKLGAPVLLYGSADEVKMPQQGQDGWEGLVGGRSSELKLEGTEAIATLALAPPAKGEMKIVAQVSYRNGAGQTVYGEPRTLSLGAAGAPPVVGPVGPADPVRPPVVAPRPSGPPKGEELTKLLADLKADDDATRQTAASILQQAPPRQRRDEVRKALQELLTAKEPATRTAGVLALTACDPKEAAPAVVKLLGDPVPAVRQAVVNALKELKDPRVAEAVAARLPVDGLGVVDVLKAMGPAAEKAVIPYLDDKYAGVTRFWTFNIIGEIGTAASLPALEKVTGPDTLHSKGVIEAVRERVPLTKEEWPQALDDLKSADAAKRRKAARRISVTAPSDDRRADISSRLELLLNDQSGDVRNAAVKGLGRWGGKGSIPILVKRLEGFDPGFHAVVIDTLAELKGDDVATAIARRVPDAFDRGKAVQALKSMDPLVAEKALLPLLSDTNVFVRCEAIKVLADLGGRNSIAPLEKLSKDNNVFYSKLAQDALARIQDRIESSDEK
jgi:S1-C subfamily serine protease/HEAT repeat protein